MCYNHFATFNPFSALSFDNTAKGNSNLIDAANSKRKSLVLDFDEETGAEILSVDYRLVEQLEPHQAEGVKFMWNACFRSLHKLKEAGSGCILAHCMGLGKSLQVVTLIHTLLMQTSVKKVLLISPACTIQNWIREFNKWLPQPNKEIEIYDISQ